MTIVLLGVGLLLLILFLGVPLGLGLMAVGYLGIVLVHPKGFIAGNSIAGQQIVDLASNFQFSVLPLFILMGVFVARAALSDRDLALNREQIGRRQFAVKGLRPEMAIASDINQLNVDSNAVTGSLYATLKNVSDAQDRSDLTDALL